MVRIKIGWKHYTTQFTHQKRAPVGRGLFGVHLLIIHVKFQFSKTIKSSAFHNFLNLTYPSRKKSLSQNAQKSPKNIHKTDK